MNDKEKLFDLINDVNNPARHWFPNNAETLKFVDYLISNDVIVNNKCEINKECGTKKTVVLQRTVHDNMKTVWSEFVEVDIEVPLPEHSTAGDWHIVGEKGVF